jgi:GNAT superfamily N-acetyltransferase
MNMAVSTAWQSKGIGSALLQRAIREMRERGVQQLEVGTGSFGDQLLFYQRLGFRVTDIERDFFCRTTPPRCGSAACSTRTCSS